ncbi:hypothetical protein JIN80_17850, partial [Cerasicoccus arenae]|nr:hypothetical protein [Cerasicoccus arenae]
GSLGEVLADESVEVFDAAFLPGVVGLAKVASQGRDDSLGGQPWHPCSAAAPGVRSGSCVRTGSAADSHRPGNSR